MSRFNRRRLSPALSQENWRGALAEEVHFRIQEAEWIEAERAQLQGTLSTVPTEKAAFIAWFNGLRRIGPGQNDPLFPFLARAATLDQLRWFLYQEVAGEAGFDDLVALTQVKLPARPKLELGRNFWDELGRGHLKGMHGGMLENLASELNLHPEPENVLPESLALGNLMVALATSRSHAYQSLGALGVIELTAPGRAEYVARALERLGVSRKGQQYFRLHATLDVKHWKAWEAEVLIPLIEDRPELALPMAEGALLRLQAGARCFRRYREELGLTLKELRASPNAATQPGLHE